MNTPTPPEPTPTAATLEKIARKLVKEADTDARAAVVLAISSTEPRKRRTTTELLRAGDVYEALRNAPRKITNDAQAVAVITCGWASPVSDDDQHPDTPPSLHPKRQRVALVITHHLDTRETVSAIRFANKRAVIVDYGTAAGSLAEAVAKLGDEVHTNRNS